MVAQICRDLGLAIDLSLWEDEDWAIEEAEARTTGSPYAFRCPEPPPWREKPDKTADPPRPAAAIGLHPP